MTTLSIIEPNSELEEDKLTIEEFVIYSSPRYYRLIFSSLKPTTKNGDLVSALNEMKKWNFLTPDSSWDRIKLTKKGTNYKKLIKKLLDYQALNVPQSNGLFDYRSEIGRRVTFELIRFLVAKLDFNEYFQYLNLPVFDEEKDNKWFKLFGKEEDEEVEDEEMFDPDSREKLIDFLKKPSRKQKRAADSIQKNIFNEDKPIQFNLKIIKSFLTKMGLNRPVPLFNHFNAVEPMIFSIHDRNFSVNLMELKKISKILEENIDDFQKDENKWLTDYFKLLKLPTRLFGFQLSNTISYASQTDAFMKVAAEGPVVFANQFSQIEELQNLQQIVFPINKTESLIINSSNLDYIYYFTLPTQDCAFEFSTDIFPNLDLPDSFRTSLRRFGRMIERATTINESLNSAKLKNLKVKETKKQLEEQIKLKKLEISEEFKLLSKHSASLFTICKLIAEKLSPNFELPKCVCIFEGGYTTHSYIDSDTILTTLNIGVLEMGKELKKILKKFDDSMIEILALSQEQ